MSHPSTPFGASAKYGGSMSNTVGASMVGGLSSGVGVGSNDTSVVFQFHSSDYLVYTSFSRHRIVLTMCTVVLSRPFSLFFLWTVGLSSDRVISPYLPARHAAV